MENIPFVSSSRFAPELPLSFQWSKFFALSSNRQATRPRFSPLGKFPLLVGLGFLFAHSALAPTPNFVQGNYAAPNNGSPGNSTAQSVTVPFQAAQTVGDLNVVVVGWNDATAQVSSLTDSKGNIYKLAVGPTLQTGSVALSQSIYYAQNISTAAAGANTVTLTFNKGAIYPDIRILEYSGIDPVSPVDVSV